MAGVVGRSTGFCQDVSRTRKIFRKYSNEPVLFWGFFFLFVFFSVKRGEEERKSSSISVSHHHLVVRRESWRKERPAAEDGSARVSVRCSQFLCLCADLETLSAFRVRAFVTPLLFILMSISTCRNSTRLCTDSL